MSELADVAALVSALVWPILVGLLLVTYRKGIQKFLTGLAPRVTGFSAGPFSIELAEAKSLELRSDVNVLDSQGTYVSGFTSAPPDLLQQIVEGPPLDYMTINLAEGQNWLVSRLYLFTSILQRIRRLRCVVFVETSNGIRHRFVGFADVNSLRWALAEAHPWLETAYASAETGSNQFPGQAISGRYTQVALLYLQSIETMDPSAPVDAANWVQLGTFWEHSGWLDSAAIERLLGGALEQSSIQKTELLVKTKAEQARLVLGMEGAFVATVDQDRRFDALINRWELAEKVARSLTSE